MTIICQICQKVFDKQISGKHLTIHHGINAKQYKSIYGNDSISIAEYRQVRSKMVSGENNPMSGRNHSQDSKDMMSNKLQGRPAHNKGKKVTDPSQLETIRTALVKRDERYAIEGHPLKGRKIPEEIKNKISESVKEYTLTHKEEILDNYKKIIEVRKTNGYYDKLRIKSEEKLALRWLEFGYILNRYNDDDKLINLTHNCGTQTIRNRDSVINPMMCSRCFVKKSVSEDELELMIWISQKLDCDIITQDKSILENGFEIDILIPSLNLGIEFNGVYWHSEEAGKNVWYHVTKHNKCLEKGIRLIQIFEDEWKYKKDIVKLRLLHSFKLSNNIQNISARKCSIERIPTVVAKDFHQIHHLQGRGTGSIAYGLKFNNDLVAVMDFAKLSISKGAKPKDDHWELSRFSVIGNIPGAASRLFTAFIREYNPIQILSYSDLRWNTGTVYQKLGFIKQGNTTPNYWYVQGDKRLHRFKFRKDQLISEGFDPTKSEQEIMSERGFKRVWDCGNTKWIWSKK